MTNTIATESITDRLLTEQYCPVLFVMQEYFQLHAIHFQIQCIFFPEVLLRTSKCHFICIY